MCGLRVRRSAPIRLAARAMPQRAVARLEYRHRMDEPVYPTATADGFTMGMFVSYGDFGDAPT